MSTFEIAIPDDQIQQIEQVLEGGKQSFDEVIWDAIALYLKERGIGR